LVRQPIVSGTTKGFVVAAVIVPLSEPNLTCVPAGIALPFTSTTATVTVAGVFPVAGLQGVNGMAALLLMDIVASDDEKTMIWLPRTSIDFWVLQIAAPGVHSTPLYLASAAS